MAGKVTKKAGAGNKEKKDIKKIAVTEFNIIRTHVFDNGNISFDATINGMTFYNISLIWSDKLNDNDGGYFISEPSRKVGDKYYKYYYLNLNDEGSDKIIDAVVKASE